MKNVVIKADRMVLNVLTYYTRRWVAWHDEKKHAIDLMITWEWVQLCALVLWAIVLPTAMYLLRGNALEGGVQAALWGCLGVMEWYGIQQTKRTVKPHHDFIWSLRHEANFVTMHKQVLEELFVKMRRSRLEHLALLWGITISVFVVAHIVTPAGNPNNLVWQYIFVAMISNSLQRYLLYVDDMSQPKRKKKASESITELLSKLWKQTIGGFAPQPA